MALSTDMTLSAYLMLTYSAIATTAHCTPMTLLLPYYHGGQSTAMSLRRDQTKDMRS
ncbi:hypothetical protein BU25DRAFT_415105 [Macroventuria anomochaeta]|uniref:Uncharacterized protein n=1 Tax=Macroventuria anomochaeta TaxID=301207 RepID=A0ACB6RKX6_9PLEO|nr:uncharacterized protein BU25DRAFT_415105 [Macroventuria anomochaeta]KAF2622610.1 hypothetical protein BU25DRAFT_415105 [Macroventuria anomochaeta]